MTTEQWNLVTEIRNLATDELQIVRHGELACIIGTQANSPTYASALGYLEGKSEIDIEHASDTGSRATYVYILPKHE